MHLAEKICQIYIFYFLGSKENHRDFNFSLYHHHYDGLGSTKALTDANQNIQSSTIYDAWGNILQANGTITNPYLYVGELGYYGDGDAGMYLLTQRWYNPVIGRFVVRDPSGPRDVVRYTYGLNNPLTMTDPSGLRVNSNIRECLRRYWDCVERANRDYEACICRTYEGADKVPSWVGFAGCTIICTVVCLPTEEVLAVGMLCHLMCDLKCEDLIEHIPDLIARRCDRLRNREIENCHYDFIACRGQTIGPYSEYTIGPYLE